MTQLDTLSLAEVNEAADRLVAAFAGTDTDGYFACFAEDASFVFHPEAEVLADRAAYERLWASWLSDGWRVESCTPTGRRVQVWGDTAVLTHDVHTVTSVAGDQTATDERETIVFRRVGGAVLAVHEHLSPAPEATR
ncbi:nuclear transport factor 2 family protein [Nocardioides sp. YIM 152588]|uniref:nuclear transport factor 2 family protein n=1 Tax=Nocardioides sp. YIM 152588 TaxID=3158259 RepID=UPI0032E41634